MSQPLPEPEGFVARDLINVLRNWHSQWPAGLMRLSAADIDCLAERAREMLEAWKQIDACLRRNGFEVPQYPVQIDRAGRP